MKIFPLLILCFSSLTVQARGVYLNGIDISSAFGQSMEKVDLRIDDKGNIFIVAPQYQVLTQDAYLPLSKAPEELPVHQKEPKQLLTPDQKVSQDEEKQEKAEKKTPAPTPEAVVAPATPVTPASPTPPAAP